MKRNKQRLWIISELFPPEETSTSYIMGEIANALSDKYSVKVICGPEVYDSQKKLDPNSLFILKKGIEIYRVKGVHENKKKVLSRIKKFLIISNRLKNLASKLIKQGDVVLLATNPFPLIIPMSKLKKSIGFELKVLVHDIFPEPLKIRMKIPAMIYNPIYSLFAKSYAGSDQLISLGRDMTDILRSKTSKYNEELLIVQIENWGDIQNIFPISRPQSLPTDKIVIQYAGNIGEAQGVQQFVAHILSVNNKNLLFSIWGAGSAEDKIKDIVTSASKNDIVNFNGPYYRSQQCEVLNNCDLALVSLRNVIRGLGVPSKSYNILAAGKPILFIGPLDSEIALMIKENEIGYCFDEFDNVGIESFLKNLDASYIPILKEMGERARRVAELKYSKKSILEKFKELI